MRKIKKETEISWSDDREFEKCNKFLSNIENCFELSENEVIILPNFEINGNNINYKARSIVGKMILKSGEERKLRLNVVYQSLMLEKSKESKTVISIIIKNLRKNEIEIDSKLFVSESEYLKIK